MYLILDNKDHIKLEKFHQITVPTEGHIEDRTNFVFSMSEKTKENVEMLKKYLSFADDGDKYNFKIVNELTDEEPIMDMMFNGFSSIEYMIDYGNVHQFVANLVYLLV